MEHIALKSKGLAYAGEGGGTVHFRLSEDQQMFKKMVRDFAENEILPTAAERDREQRFDPSIWRKMAELDLCGIPFEQEYGGAGLGYLSYIIAVEELSRVCAATGITLSSHISLCCWPIHEYARPEQKAKYLRMLTSGEKMGAFAMTEPWAGSDASSIRTRCRLEGDEWVLDGTKLFTTNAPYADIYIVMARTGSADDRHRNTCALVVEKGSPGFTFGRQDDKMGIRGSATCQLVFDNCRIPRENLLGQVGEGFAIAMRTLDGGRIGVAAQAVGIAQAAYEYALRYAKERIQFEKPIATFQAIQFKLADMATRIEAARLLTYQAAWLQENGFPYSKESAFAKVFAGDVAMWVTTEAVQVLGGHGYIKDHPVERYMRDAKITQIYEGTAEVQRMVIANHILK